MGLRSICSIRSKAEEFSLRVLRLSDTVGHDQERVARFQLERSDRKFHPGEYPHRKRPFDLHLDAVEIGGELAGIGQLDSSIRREAQEHTGRTGGFAFDELFVEHLEHMFGTVVVLRSGTDGADDQSNEHSGLQSFARYIAERDERGAVPFVRHDLKEITANLACWTILAVDVQTVELG